MASRKKREQKFSKAMQIKLTAIFASVLCLLLALNILIAYINAKSGEKYAKRVLSQQTYDSRTIPYRRGEILDRNGNILAKSDKVYNVILDCNAINDLEDPENQVDYIEPTVRAVAEVFGLDEAEIRDLIVNEETRESQYQVIKKEISLEEKQAFEDYTDLSEDRNLSDAQRLELEHVTGVWFEEDYVRSYPMNSLACTVLGFANKLNDGIFGLESYYTDVLNGVDGREYGYLNEDKELQSNIVEPEDGSSVVSTIDINIQQVVERHIAELEAQNCNGPQEETPGRASKNTAVIVADPNSGEILAMATDKVFDLNDPQNLSGWYNEKELAAMDDEKRTEALNSLWYNYCVSEAFELGSTYKPIVVASALDSGSVDTNFSVQCVGYLQPVAEEDPINCTGVHGEETLLDVVRNSCNPGMMTVGQAMGVEEFCRYQSNFGFGKRTGIDLPNENSGALYDENTMHIMELCTNTFGQGFTATMIQELSAFCAVVNGGYYYKPHMVKQILDGEGGVAQNVEPLLVSQPVSTKTSYILREYLEAVVTNGTATDAQIAGYRVGGKTGTAEKLPRGNNKYIISYIAAVPIDDPEVVVYAVIDEPNIANQEDGTYTKKLVTDILSEILPYMGIYPTEEITQEQKDSLGIQVDKEPETEMVAQYVYDEWGNLMYDTNTWEPLTEMVAVEVTGDTEDTEQIDNLYGNVNPPEQQGDTSVDENWSDGVTQQDVYWDAGT
ncbi:MAG: penicillin-binding transpeptidase domain-containing protein [Eubacteriales bacterium]|nr:penicillin-binding transpeptidase domain-containing protein [Eubacteriales bacterium]